MADAERGEFKDPSVLNELDRHELAELERVLKAKAEFFSFEYEAVFNGSHRGITPDRVALIIGADAVGEIFGEDSSSKVNK